MDMSDMSNSLEQITIDQFGVNKLLVNVILQMFLKNNIDDPEEIINTLSDYLEVPVNSSIMVTLANELNISFINGLWVWVIN